MLEKFPEYVFTEKDGVIEITTEVKDASAINRALVDAGIAVYELAERKMEFEDFFIGKLGK